MNTFGTMFRLSVFGESHGEMIGVTIDGVPAGLPLSEEDFRADLARRRKNMTGTTARREEDAPRLVSGILNGYATGAPVTIIFHNNDARSEDYDKFREIPRPGHADFVADVKYRSFNDLRGGGHFSGRLTLALVAAGTIAKKILGQIRIKAEIVEIGGISDSGRWEELLEKTVAEGDSAGGVISCKCDGVPVGLGEPFFDGLESKIAHLLFAIPGIRGIEFGDGFRSAAMRGSEHNDCYTDKYGHTSSNGAGGVNGGISNGNQILFRVAVKPASSISKEQKTFNMKSGKTDRLKIEGRHDACIALRCPPVIEAAAAIALADAMLTAGQTINFIF